MDRPRSLRTELVAGLVLPLSVVVAFNVWTTYRSASASADLITDRTLLASAQVIAERIRHEDGLTEAPIPPAALEMFASDLSDKVVYSVTAADGELIAGSPEFPDTREHPKDFQPLFFDTTFRGLPMRAVAVGQPILSDPAGGAAIVAIGQTLSSHDRLVRGLWFKALRDQVVLVTAAGLLAAYGLRRGLLPILRLRDDVVVRDPSDFEPFAARDVQRELRPLLEALNEALSRTRRLLETQRRFVANAAHQLRTPLTLLKMQASLGLRESDPRAKDETLAAIDLSLDRLVRLSNQLLSLARAEQGSPMLAKSDIEFDLTVRDALGTLAQAALLRGIDMGLERCDADCRVRGHATLLHELVVNLADNALRYTPPGGVVTVGLRQDGEGVVLMVEDSGPGIPEADRERVFERFFRRLGTETDGTGLGLAIVREIVLSHDGTIELRDRAERPGLLVEVRLPVAPGCKPAISSSN